MSNLNTAISRFIPSIPEKRLNNHYIILVIITIAHFINDLTQAIAPAIYPQLERMYNLSLSQIGLITLCAQLSASVLQPFVGNFTDKYPQPFSQFFSMCLSSLGIIILAYADSYLWVLVAVTCIGTAASIFHPESSRVANLSSGGRLNLSQSIFQLGGYAGLACAPLLAVFLIVPNGQRYILWVLLLTCAVKILLIHVGLWRQKMLKSTVTTLSNQVEAERKTDTLQVRRNIIILLILIFSKYFFSAGITNYFQFYAIRTFGLAEGKSQLLLFYFLLATALATLLGGMLADRWSKIAVIRLSVLGSIPLALLLPYVDLWATVFILIACGFILSLSFSPILVYAQQLMPHKIGAISGLFYGFAMGMSGLGAACLGVLADLYGINYTYTIISLLPLLGFAVLFFSHKQKAELAS